MDKLLFCRHTYEIRNKENTNFNSMGKILAPMNENVPYFAILRFCLSDIPIMVIDVNVN